LRLIRHIAPGQTTPKAMALRGTVRTEFKKYKHVQDAIEIEQLHSAAVRGLSNYKLLTAATSTNPAAAAKKKIKTPRGQAKTPPTKTALQERIQDFHKRSVEEAKEHDRKRNR
jgi:Complex 1 protein (LYR family)